MLTLTGTFEPAVDPLPSWPKRLAPHATAADPVSADATGALRAEATITRHATAMESRRVSRPSPNINRPTTDPLREYAPPEPATLERPDGRSLTVQRDSVNSPEQPIADRPGVAGRPTQPLGVRMTGYLPADPDEWRAARPPPPDDPRSIRPDGTQVQQG